MTSNQDRPHVNGGRREFPQAVKDAAWKRCGGLCEGVLENGSRCGLIVVRGTGTRFDHIIPDWMGGDNTLENCQVLGLCCDKPKTARDQKNIAKAKRIIKKREGRMRPKKQIKSKGFGGWRTFSGKLITKRR